jgi:hypothetical protein
MSDIGGAIRSIDELVDEVTRLHVLLRGNRDYPGILEESVKLIDKLDGVAGYLASASLLSEQLGALPEIRSLTMNKFTALASVNRCGTIRRAQIRLNPMFAFPSESENVLAAEEVAA